LNEQWLLPFCWNWAGEFSFRIPVFI
jgi:hypothetical protein